MGAWRLANQWLRECHGITNLEDADVGFCKPNAALNQTWCDCYAETRPPEAAAYVAANCPGSRGPADDEDDFHLEDD